MFDACQCLLYTPLQGLAHACRLVALESESDHQPKEENEQKVQDAIKVTKFDVHDL